MHRDRQHNNRALYKLKGGNMQIGYLVRKKGTNKIGIITWVSYSGWRVKYLTGDGEKECSSAWLEVIK